MASTNEIGDTASASLPLANNLDGYVGYQVRRASAALLAEFAAALAPLGLRIPEASILILLDDNPDATQADLGRALGIQRANMAPLAAALIARGLVEKSVANGRAQGLRTTAKGRDLASRARACSAAHEETVLPDLTPYERAALLGLLRRMWKGEAA